MPHPYLAKVTRMAWDGRKSGKEEVEERVEEEMNGGRVRGEGGIKERKERGNGKKRRRKNGEG